MAIRRRGGCSPGSGLRVRAEHRLDAGAVAEDTCSQIMKGPAGT